MTAPRAPGGPDYAAILARIGREVRPLLGRGKVASYLPALAVVPPRRFAMAVATVGGERYCVGDADERFSIQSISKLFTLTLAIKRRGARLWQRVGREPSGTRFNSLVQLEHEHGIPRNPFINAGAHVVSDCLVSDLGDPKRELLDLLQRLTGIDDIAYDATVARSERETGHTNRALANFLKSFGNLENEVQAVLDVYFHQCAIAMSCNELARACLYLANEGVVPANGEAIVGPRLVKRINALMMTCGTYDVVGDFAYRVGLPAKSGVGGGIVAVLPRTLAVAVWSPALNRAGNSLAGTKALELFTTKTGQSVF